jgi:hypothetical protein
VVVVDAPPGPVPPAPAGDRGPATVVDVEDEAAPDGAGAAPDVVVAPAGPDDVVDVAAAPPDAAPVVVWVAPSAQMEEKSGAVAGAGADGLAGPGFWNRQPSTSPEVTTCSAGPSLA